MKKTFKMVLSTTLAAAIVACSSLFGAYANGENLEEFMETAAEDTFDMARAVVSSGTYYISNVQFDDKVMQIDNNASPSTSGAILELWGFDGGTYQQWKLSRLYNGGYSIRSVASGLALTAPEKPDAPLTQTEYTSADTQQWNIIRTSDNLFKLSPKSNPSYFMSAGSGAFTSNGRNVEMRSNQSDNKDEWYFLNIQKKFTQITVYSDDLSFNSAVREKYMKNAQAYGTTYTNINKANFLSELKSSNFFGAMIHGRSDELQLPNGEILTISDISNIPDSSFKNVKIVILTSCYAGMEFVDLLHSKGVNVVIGFLGEIEQNTAAYWTDALIASLSEGNTVREALNNADEALGNFVKSHQEYAEFAYMIFFGHYTGDSNLDLRPCDYNNL